MTDRELLEPNFKRKGMKVSELTGAQLDYWVARAEGMICHIEDDENDLDEKHCIARSEFRHFKEYVFAPSTDWSHGGPIIERGLINVYWFPHDSQASPGHWEGFIRVCDDDGFPGDTPLVAAMRAYVASAFGDEVPDEVQP